MDARGNADRTHGDLLIGAGLLLRSFQQLARVDPGFEPGHVLTFQVSGSWGETSEMKNVIQRIDRTLESLRTLPGVEAASTAAMLPGVPSQYQTEFKIDGKLETGHPILADSRYVSAGYFDTMRIPLLVGESCRQASSTSDVMVNRAFADKYMGDTLALGHQVSGAVYNDFLPEGIIRGIVGDAREEGLNTQAGAYGVLLLQRAGSVSQLPRSHAWRPDGDGGDDSTANSRDRAIPLRICFCSTAGASG